jgi:hypothetical protein
MASYPAAPVVFPARSDGQTVFAQHMNAVQDEIAAIEASLVGGTLPNPQRIVGTNPTLVLDDNQGGGALSKVRLNSDVNGNVNLTSNADYPGGLWTADDVASLSALLQLQPQTGRLVFYNAPVGPNPRSFNVLFQVQSDGSIRERGRAAALGDWTNVPFNAADYTGSGSMTWPVIAGNVALFRYAIAGKTAFVQMDITGAVLGGTASSALRVALPAAITPGGTGAQQLVLPAWIQTQASSLATGAVGIVVITGGVARIDFYCTPLTNTNWTLAVAPRVNGSFAFQIQ